VTLRRWGDVHAGGESRARAGEGVILELLRHYLSVLISARQDVASSPEGSICVVVCRTEIGCRSNTFLVTFQWNFTFFNIIFEKFSNIKFHENPCSGSRAVQAEGRRDIRNKAYGSFL